MDLETILQAIQRIRPDMLQGILGSLGGGMQSINGGGFQVEPFAPEPAGPSWNTRPFEPFPMPAMPGRGGRQQFEPFPMPPMARGGGIPSQVTPDVPGAGSGGRSAGMGSFGPGRLDLPGLRQPMPDRFRGAIGMGGTTGGGNQIATRPAPGRGGNAVVPRKRVLKKPKYGGASSRGY